MATIQHYTVKGNTYYRLVESKRINGKPTPVILEYYGNAKKFAERLTSGEFDGKTLKSFSHGDTFALLKMAKKIGVVDIIDSIIPTNGKISVGKTLLLLAIQNACSPGSKNSFADWYAGTSLRDEFNFDSKVLTSQHFWRQMDGISVDQLNSCEDTITKKILDLYQFEIDTIALDYTNYFSYISSDNDCSLAKRGRNKQKRSDLRQYSLALVTTKETCLPLYSQIYPGNTNDQTEFPLYTNMLKQRLPNWDPCKLTLVFDGGNNTKHNLSALETHYICRFSLSCAKELYDIANSKYHEIELGNGIARCYRLTHEIWGKERECILTLSDELYMGQLKELDRDIANCIAGLNKVNTQLSNPKSKIDKSIDGITARVGRLLNKPHMKEVFIVKVTAEAVEFSVDDRVRDEIATKFFGKKLIISDRADWSTAEILRVYRDQDNIEKLFRDTKNANHFAIRPQYHYTDQKIRVHIFCCLLGLSLATILHKEIANEGLEISRIKMLDELHKIRQCWVKRKSSLKVDKQLEEMADVQEKIWGIIEKIK